MIAELLVTVIIIVAGCIVFLQVYDLFESEAMKTVVVATYCFFVLFMLLKWFADYIIYQL